MTACSPAALAALLCTTLALGAPSLLPAQTAEPQAPPGLSLEPRIVYLGALTVHGTASCGEAGCGWRAFSSQASEAFGPGGRLQVAGAGPLVVTAGLAVPREVHGPYRANFVVGHVGVGYRIQPQGWILPAQVEVGVTRVRADLRRESGVQRWGLWGPSAGAELIARLNPRLFASAGADVLILFPTHATAMALARRQVANVVSVRGSKSTAPQYHAGVAIRIGHMEP